MQPTDTSAADGRGPDRASGQRGPDHASADTATESQSAYLRAQHRDDAEPGDASADEHEVRMHTNYETRRGDSAAPAGQGAEQARQAAFTRAEEATDPTADPGATR